ncbi:unnamed protein product [Arctogadus glacialis]
MRSRLWVGGAIIEAPWSARGERWNPSAELKATGGEWGDDERERGRGNCGEIPQPPVLLQGDGSPPRGERGGFPLQVAAVWIWSFRWQVVEGSRLQEIKASVHRRTMAWGQTLLPLFTVQSPPPPQVVHQANTTRNTCAGG